MDADVDEFEIARLLKNANFESSDDEERSEEIIEELTDDPYFPDVVDLFSDLEENNEDFHSFATEGQEAFIIYETSSGEITNGEWGQDYKVKVAYKNGTINFRVLRYSSFDVEHGNFDYDGYVLMTNFLYLEGEMHMNHDIQNILESRRGPEHRLESELLEFLNGPLTGYTLVDTKEKEIINDNISKREVRDNSPNELLENYVSDLEDSETEEEAVEDKPLFS